jgi:hypothetical protein
MLSRLFQLFKKESFDCVGRYGITPKEFLMAGLKLSPTGSVLEVSDIDFGLLSKNFIRIADYKSLIFGSGGEAFNVDDIFIDQLRAYDGIIPDVYCLLGDDTILLSVINHGEILDFSRNCLTRLDNNLINKHDKKIEKDAAPNP